MAKSNVVRVAGYKVRLPCTRKGKGRKCAVRKTKLSETEKSKILSSVVNKKLTKSDKCIIAKMGGTWVQRCEGRKLKAHNRKQCRVKKRGRNYGKFRKC